MDLSQRSKTYNTTIADYLGGFHYDLEDDGASLSNCIGTGTSGYGFSGAELDIFLKLCIKAIVEQGGRPTVHFDCITFDPRYEGLSPDEIADGVVAEWHAKGEPDPDWYEFWFMRPDVLVQKKADLEQAEIIHRRTGAPL
jgi:hypothetical protein